MSGLLPSFLEFTFGILCDKIRDATADRLSEGDLTDEKFRRLIVRELDDIKWRIDSLARKDLLSSLSFFKEGISRLNMSFQEHSDTLPDEENTDGISSKKASLLSGAWGLANTIRELEIDSDERFKDAKRSFRTSREEATRAFNNISLSTDDRIMASKLRIVSRILEGLQDPRSATHDCLLYIEELHATPAVKETFSVHVRGGMKSRLNQTKRLVNLRSILSLNYSMLEFASKFSQVSIGVYNWPSIELQEYHYHPLFDDDVNLKALEKNKMKLIWETEFTERQTIEGYHSCAINSKGEIYIIQGKWNRLANIKVVKRSGRIELFNGSTFGQEMQVMYSVCSLTIDANDNVYLGICCLDTCSEGIRVIIFNTGGCIEHDIMLNASPEYFASDFCMKVTEDRIITCFAGGRLDFFDKKDHMLKIYYNLPHYKSAVECSYLSISDENDVIVNYPQGKRINIYTELGELKQMMKLPRKQNSGELVHTVRGVVFDPIRKHIQVLVYDPFLYDNASYRLMIYSKSCTLLNIIRLVNFPIEGVVQLTSHPTGPIAVIGSTKAMFVHV